MVKWSRCLAFMLLFTHLKLSSCYLCDFFKDISVRITPKSRFPFPATQMRDHVSGCIEQIKFDEIIKDITFVDQKIKMIGDNAINNMPDLVKVAFEGCPIEKVTRLSFRNLPKLEILFIRAGNLTKIKTEIFNDLPNLRIINLHDNQIDNIAIYSFAYIASLEQVIVSKNMLTSIFHYWFQNSTKIDLLDFSQNKIENITRFDFLNTPNLRDLFLDYNDINYIEKNAFSHLTNITFLGLSHNRLKEIDPDIFPSKIHIEALLINANYLNFLSSQLLGKLSVKELTLEGNPWKCPCLEKINKWMYSTTHSRVRKTPFCLESNIPVCNYDSEYLLCVEKINEEMTQSYVNNLKKIRPPINEICAQLN